MDEEKKVFVAELTDFDMFCIVAGIVLFIASLVKMFTTGLYVYYTFTALLCLAFSALVIFIAGKRS